MASLLIRCRPAAASLKALLPSSVSPSASAPAAGPLATHSQVARICHKDHIDPEILRDKPAPWPYDSSKHTWFDQFVLRRDRCVRRWDENSVVIAIEGPMAVGKEAFGAKLADLLGMRFYGEATVEPLYLREDGYDLRLLNFRLPESGQYVDQKLFYLNPSHLGVPSFLYYMYVMKFFHYLEGLTHLYNTGQGVVQERTPFSDYVFHECLYKMGLIKRDFKEFYHDVYVDTHQTIHRPHVVIYLDIPPEESLKRFIAKSPAYVKESPIVNLEYFTLLDQVFKQHYLPAISKHADVLVYDWSQEGDLELVVEDLEALDFSQYERMTEKLEDWRKYKSEDYDWERHIFTNRRVEIYKWFNQPTYDKPSVLIPQEVLKLREELEKAEVHVCLSLSSLVSSD